MTDASRRRFLKRVGVTATAFGAAGCEEQSGGNTTTSTTDGNVVTHRPSAFEVGLHANALWNLGFPAGTVNHITETKTFAHTTAQKKHLVHATGHKYSFHGPDVDFPVQIYATPAAKYDGILNPTWTQPSNLLASGAAFGPAWLWLTGILPLNHDTPDGSVLTGSREQASHQLLNNSVDYVLVTEEFGASKNSSKQNTTTIQLMVGMTIVNGTIVVVGVATGFPSTESGYEHRLDFMIEEAIWGAFVNPPTKPINPVKGSIRDPRVVQTVSRTRVENGSVVFHHPHDPDLVGGEEVAPIFGVSNRPPKRVYCDATVKRGAGSNATKRFWLHREDAKMKVGDQAAKFDRATRHPRRPAPPTFTAGTQMNAIDLAVEAPSGVSLGTTSLQRGRDYTTAAVRPVRVGFIPVYDDSTWTDYGGNNGRPDTYEETVDLAVEYMDHTFPGQMHAFRLDSNHVRGAFEQYVHGDAWRARVILENERQAGNFPNNGEIITTDFEDSTAEQNMRNHGFDGWVAIVPNGYWNYHHFPDAAGVAVPGKRYGVIARERAAAPSQSNAAWVTAQELAHHFADNPYKIPSGPNNDYPMAQRAGALNERVKVGGQAGGPAGWADIEHARHKDSASGANNSGPTDHPGVVSECFDLTDGLVNVVEDYNVDRHSFDADTDSRDATVDRLESFMSYTGDTNTWADAEIRQELIDSNWQGQSLGQFVFSAMGTVNAEDQVEFVDTYAYEGSVATKSEEGGTVNIALEDPDGEPTVARQVDPVLHPTHMEPIQGVLHVQVPFPERSVSFRVRRPAGTTRINPVTRVLRDAVDRIPDRGFLGSPAESRGSLRRAVDDVHSQMSERQYGAAIEALRYFSELLSDTVRVEYEAVAMQPVRADLARLVEAMIVRIEALG